MKNYLVLLGLAAALCGCEKADFDEAREGQEVMAVPVVLREQGARVPARGQAARQLAAAAQVVTVTVFRTEQPKGQAVSAGSQLISLPVHPVQERCTSNDLALVGGVPVPAAEFYQLFSQPNLDAMPNYLRRTYDKERGEYIRQLINNKIFEYAAAHEDFSGEPGYAAAVEDAVHKVNLEFFYDRYISGGAAVSDQEVAQHYEAHKAEYTKPAQFKAAHILVKVDPNAYRAEVSNAFNRATELRRRALEGEDFGQLAAAYSECPSKVRGGELDFFTKGQTHPAFERAAERLKIGEISPVVETSQGYHVIKLLDRVPERVRSLEETKDEIRGQLELKKAGDAYDKVLNSLTNKYEVIRNENLIRKLVEQY